MNLDLPEELEMVRATARAFVREHLRPHEAKIDAADHFDADLFRELRLKAAAAGLYAHNLPEALGGAGLSMLGQVVVGEELGRTSMPLADAVGFIPPVIGLASPEQRSWFLDPLASGELTATYAVTEPGAGSDIGAMTTRARRSGDDWIINGFKHYITGSDFADFLLVVAVTDPDAPLRSRFTVFIVDRHNPGFKYVRDIPKMGWRGYHFGAFALDDCQVPHANVLGTVGGGFSAIMDTINLTRIEYSGRYVGMADELLRLAVDYVKQRKTFGNALSHYQATQFALADCDCELQAARLLTYQAATLADQGDARFRMAASRSKLYASEMVGRVADRVLQLFGGAGYTTDLPIERMYRDARAFRIGEGTSEMQRVQIARALVES